LVTHDQEEAFELADQVVILNHGRVEQTGAPQAIVDRPSNPFVESFLGLAPGVVRVLPRRHRGEEAQEERSWSSLP
jgi:sulfate transport system ATP-binding protein